MAEFIVTHRREAIGVDLDLLRKKRRNGFDVSGRIGLAAIFQRLCAVFLPIGVKIIEKSFAKLVARAFMPPAADIARYETAFFVLFGLLRVTHNYLCGGRWISLTPLFFPSSLCRPFFSSSPWDFPFLFFSHLW